MSSVEDGLLALRLDDDSEASGSPHRFGARANGACDCSDDDEAPPTLRRIGSASLHIPSPEAAARRPELVGPTDARGELGGAPTPECGGCAEAAAPPLRRTPSDFDILSLVGQGAFGKVFQVREKATHRVYAMKVMRKAHVLEKNADGYMRTEQSILTRVDHPFIVTLFASFQTPSKLYLVMDFVNGGHLFFQLARAGLFEERLARVYSAELALALGHLHGLGIIHRDLKPENVLLDAEGHIKVTDFGLAAVSDPDGKRHNSLAGTLEYMAPEVVNGRGHSKNADWWSLGVLLFEMLTGSAPFKAKNRSLLQKKILAEKVVMPKFLSHSANRLLTSLLCRDEAKRLGSGPDGTSNVKAHAFFESISWERLARREIEAPFKPSVGGALCTANFDAEHTGQAAADSPGATPDGGGAGAFVGYSWLRPSAMPPRDNARGA